MFSVAYIRVICFMVRKRICDGKGKITAVKQILIPFQCRFLCLYHKCKNPFIFWM